MSVFNNSYAMNVITFSDQDAIIINVSKTELKKFKSCSKKKHPLKIKRCQAKI